MSIAVAVLGGTRFIGRRIVDDLLAAGHDVLVVHRGESEPPGLPDVQHVHADRLSLGGGDAHRALAAFRPDAVLDCVAMTAADSDAVLAAVAALGARLVVLSSMDVYRAYTGVHTGTVTDAVPLDESSPTRSARYPYRGSMPGMDDYEKLDVEERFLARDATVLRLPMVYGEHDYQRRQEIMLRRVRAGRRRIPIGSGTGAFTHGYVGDVAEGVRLVLERTDLAGEIFNLGERRSSPMALLCRRMLDAAGASEVELVRVPDDSLPGDMRITGAIAQPLLVDSSKARSWLGWDESDPDDALRRTVAWHLDHPPEGAGDSGGSGDFSDDDAALALARRRPATE